MKRLITLLALIVATQFIQAQEVINRLDGNGFVFSTQIPTQTEIVSKFDTVILNAGKVKCKHEWAIKRPTLSTISCAVYHNSFTCPDYWLNQFRVCKWCLRHENIKETQYIKEDEYEATIKKLKKP